MTQFLLFGRTPETLCRWSTILYASRGGCWPTGYTETTLIQPWVGIRKIILGQVFSLGLDKKTKTKTALTQNTFSTKGQFAKFGEIQEWKEGEMSGFQYSSKRSDRKGWRVEPYDFLPSSLATEQGRSDQAAQPQAGSREEKAELQRLF